MQRRWAVAIVFLLMAEVALPASPGEDAMGAIDNCLLRLDVDVDVGFERISARCPQLTRHMHGADWAAWLPAGWNDPYNDVSARSLVQLQMLVVRDDQNAHFLAADIGDALAGQAHGVDVQPAVGFVQDGELGPQHGHLQDFGPLHFAS